MGEQFFTVEGRRMPLSAMEGGAFYHGTVAKLEPSEIIRPGFDKNFRQSSGEDVSITSYYNHALHWAGDVARKKKSAKAYVYEVEPIGRIQQWNVGLADFARKFHMFEARVKEAKVVKLILEMDIPAQAKRRSRENPGWWRAVHRYVSPRERPLTELEAWVRDVAYGIKNNVSGAITVAAEEMAKFVPEGSVIVPAPSSKAGGYGGVAALADRVAQLSHGISAALVSRETSVPSSHERRRAGGHGLPVEEHVASMKAAPGLEGRKIVLVDNVAMSGSTLEAMRVLLSGRSPDVRAVVWAEGVI